MGWTRRQAVTGMAAWAAAAAGHAQGPADIEGGTLRIVVPYPPGGGTDRAARLLADALHPLLGATVIVENRVGAGGRLAVQQVHKEPAARNVLLLANPAPMLVAPLLIKEDGYDVARDYRALSEVTRYAFGVAVGPAVPVKEFGPLRGWMQANRDKITVGVPATGSLPHFFALMLAQQLGIEMPVAGYRGSAPLANDLMGGHVPLAVDTIDALEPLHKAGKLRILANSAERRSTTLADVPTFQEVGLKLSAVGWNVLYAPSAMPPERAARIGDAVHRALADPAVRSRFATAELEVIGSTPADTRKMLAGYAAQWTPVIQASGIKM